MKEKKIHSLIITIVIILITGAFIIIPSKLSGYTPHSPIYIDGNADFATQASNEGWAGDGSPGNPYIIENYDIDASGTHGIWIKNTNVSFIIRNCYIHDGGTNNNGIHIETVVNATIENSNIVDNQYGIYLRFSSNITIANNTCNSHYRYGLFIWYSPGNKIDNNTFNANGWEGIELNSSPNNTVTNNTCNSSRNRSGLWIWGSINNTFSSNTIRYNEQYCIEFQSSSNGNIFEYNICTDNRYGMNMASCSNNTIAHNDFSSNIWDGILMSSSSGNTIINNYCNYSTNSYGINLQGSTGNTITKNVCNSNDNYGIYLRSSRKNMVDDNICFSNRRGIYMDYSSNNTINNNYCRFSTSTSAIGVIRSYDNIFTNNTLNSNEWHSFSLYLSTNNTFTNNYCISSISNGFNLDTSDLNVITKNIISDNQNYGVQILNSENNSVFHNNFIDNNAGGIQALDNTDKNFWNDSYPSGGNYWSDFDEPGEGAYDDYKGLDQNILEGDGIVDNGSAMGGGKNPYVIDANSQDDYPLIRPYIGNSFYLHQGWNLISLPSIQSNISLTSVLQPIDGKYDAVQWYNASDQTDFWKHCHISKPPHLNDLNEITHKIGFWVHITASGGTIFSYSGTKPIRNQTIYLYPGWNQIGYPSLSYHNRTTGLNNLTFDTQVDCIQWYDAKTMTWHFMGPNDDFVPGKGYWVHSKVEAEWEVPL